MTNVTEKELPLTPEYTVRRVGGVAPGDWTDSVWDHATKAQIEAYHPKGSDHKPLTDVRVLYNDDHLFLRFAVRDRYVKSVGLGWQAPVCRDACVEAFLMPKLTAALPHPGYFNFETNCGGAMLAYYIEDSRRVAGGFARFKKLQTADFEAITIHHSLPSLTTVEIAEPVEWFIQLNIPFALFEKFAGPLGPMARQHWRGNFLKCADQCSHPHWGAWAEIGTELNFHQPQRFGDILFEG